MISLEIHICDQRRSYLATWEGDVATVTPRVITFLGSRGMTHAWNELEAMPVPIEATELLAYLYPSCEHGLSLSNCNGPQHYWYDEEEQSRGRLNS